MRGLPCKRVQVDEIWAFVYAKAKNAPTVKAAPEAVGDCWTWMAIDVDTKLIPSYYVGARDAYAAQAFIGDLASRLVNRVQLTSDGHKPYLEAVMRLIARIDMPSTIRPRIWARASRESLLMPSS